MSKFNYIIFIFLFILLNACSKEVKKENIISETDINLQLKEVYQEGLDSLDKGDVLYAAKKFNEAEVLFPQSIWAPRAALMAAYSYYSQNYYGDAIAELERFIKIYPNHESISYVHYLLGICFYEKIVDEKKDLKAILNAKEKFTYIIKTYSGSDYAFDSELKLDQVNDILASKEVYIGRYYFEKKKWIPAINRFKSVIDNYSTTIYVEEALHRLVEIHFILGLKEESEKYAYLLGYNYQSSQWYEKSYSLFDSTYKKKRDKEKNKKKLTKKIKSFFK
jgi:outer membrane protein assembly factor BamD